MGGCTGELSGSQTKSSKLHPLLPLYGNLKILKLNDQIILQNCLFVHDVLNNISPICFKKYFKNLLLVVVISDMD